MPMGDLKTTVLVGDRDVFPSQNANSATRLPNRRRDLIHLLQYAD